MKKPYWILCASAIGICIGAFYLTAPAPANAAPPLPSCGPPDAATYAVTGLGASCIAAKADASSQARARVEYLCAPEAVCACNLQILVACHWSYTDRRYRLEARGMFACGPPNLPNPPNPLPFPP